MISCLKCKYSRREKFGNNHSQTNEIENEIDEIEILNKLDEQNEQG